MSIKRKIKGYLIKCFALFFFGVQAQSNQSSQDTSSNNKIRISISYNFFPYTQKFMEPGLFDFAKTIQPDSGKYSSTHITKIPIGFSVVKSISKTIHIGGVINYQEYNGAVFNRNNKSVFGYKGRLLQMMFRFNWQFITTKEVETYLATSVGFRNNKYILIKGNNYTDPVISNFIAAEFLLGFRIKLTKYFAIFSEFGVSNTPFKLGICLMNKPTNPFKNDSPYY